MGSDLAAARCVQVRPGAALLRLSVIIGLALALSGCISVKPYWPKAKYPTSRAPSTAPDRPTAGDQALGRYKVGTPYKVDDVWYVPAEQPDYDEVGMASWYGDEFHNRLTANGELFDMNAYSGAHKTLPMPSIVEVTNLENGKTMRVRLNDRGPFVGERIIDLSRAAASSLGFRDRGVTKVRVRYIGPAKLLAPSGQTSAQAPAAWQQADAPAPPQTSLDSLIEQDLAPIPLSQATPIAPPAPPPPAPPPPAVETSALPPLPVAAIPAEPDYSAQSAPYGAQQMAGGQARAGAYQVVVGAFASQVSAETLVQQLAGLGQARLVAVDRAGQTLYRVVVDGLANEAQALLVQQKAVSLGLTDARLVQP
jgi:rare lipoprotein A